MTGHSLAVWSRHYACSFGKAQRDEARARLLEHEIRRGRYKRPVWVRTLSSRLLELRVGRLEAAVELVQFWRWRPAEDRAYRADRVHERLPGE